MWDFKYNGHINEGEETPSLFLKSCCLFKKLKLSDIIHPEDHYFPLNKVTALETVVKGKL